MTEPDASFPPAEVAVERLSGLTGTPGHPDSSEAVTAMMHREMLGEWRDVGRPPLCDMCGGFYDSRGGWMMLPTCAASPLSHEELCAGKSYRGDVCPTCKIALNTPRVTS